jgi:8-oxo-dGTP diphosphatase
VAGTVEVNGNREKRDPATGNRSAPAIDLRAVIFSISDGRLRIRLRDQDSRLRVPAASPEEGVSLDFSARELVYATLDHTEQYLEQLYTLSLQESEGWTVVVSYIALVSSSRFPLHDEGGAWYSANDLSALDEGDRMVIEYALMRLRAKLSYTTIAFHMLPEDFTLSELQNAYETILGQKLDKRNFRRRMSSSGILSLTGSTRREGSHRPARLYRFRSDRDPTNYLTPPWTQEQP